MLEPEARFDWRAFNRLVRRFPKVVSDEMGRGFKLYLRAFESRLVEERLSGDPIRRRTGALARGWKVVVRGQGLHLVGILFTNVPYARIQEFGGTVRPKKGRWLWIPGQELLTRAGVFRGWDRVDWEGQHGDLWYRKSRRNPRNLVLLYRRGKRGKIRHIATLAKEVRIEGRMGLRELVLKDYDRRVRMLQAALERAAGRVAR